MRGVRYDAARVANVICKACGTEIADKALICYRCGEATAGARVKPHAPRSRRSRVPVAIGVVLLLVAGLYTLYIFYGGQAGSEGASWRLGWVLVGLALVALAWRVWGR